MHHGFSNYYLKFFIFFYSDLLGTSIQWLFLRGPGGSHIQIFFQNFFFPFMYSGPGYTLSQCYFMVDQVGHTQSIVIKVKLLIVNYIIICD